MEQIPQVNPQWQVWMMQQQRYTNLLMAIGTITLAIVGILQVIKLYDFSAPGWILMTLFTFLALFVVFIILILLKRDFVPY